MPASRDLLRRSLRYGAGLLAFLAGFGTTAWVVVALLDLGEVPPRPVRLDGIEILDKRLRAAAGRAGSDYHWLFLGDSLAMAGSPNQWVNSRLAVRMTSKLFKDYRSMFA